MKKQLKAILTLALISVLSLSCSKDDSDADESKPKFTDTPTANVIFDGSNLGTYKGVFTGSTGIIEINLDENIKSVVLTIDGIKYTYITTETISNGQVTSGLTFTNGGSSFDFNVGASGEEPNITNITIVDHPLASIKIQKEKSDKIVKCYVGTAHDHDQAELRPFNFCVSGTNLIGIAYNDGGAALLMTGTVLSNNTFTGVIYYPDGTTVTANIEGTIAGENIEGTWTNTIEPGYGPFSGNRAL